MVASMRSDNALSKALSVVSRQADEAFRVLPCEILHMQPRVPLSTQPGGVWSTVLQAGSHFMAYPYAYSPARL